MSSAKSQDSITAAQIERDWSESAWEAIRAQLEQKRRSILDAIAQYPHPIPACDQHFNYLLEERLRLSLELRRLNGAAAASLTSEEPRHSVQAFIESCPDIFPDLLLV